MRKAAWLLAIVLLLGTGVIGIHNGVTEVTQGTNTLQRSVTVAVFLYGVFGMAGGVGLARRLSWSRIVAIAWAVATVYAASVASFAFSDPEFTRSETVAGVIGAFVSTALIGALVVWAARSATRSPAVNESGARAAKG